MADGSNTALLRDVKAQESALNRLLRSSKEMAEKEPAKVGFNSLVGLGVGAGVAYLEKVHPLRTQVAGVPISAIASVAGIMGGLAVMMMKYQPLMQFAAPAVSAGTACGVVYLTKQIEASPTIQPAVPGAAQAAIAGY